MVMPSLWLSAVGMVLAAVAIGATALLRAKAATA
jgi:hypothetical protein